MFFSEKKNQNLFLSCSYFVNADSTVTPLLTKVDEVHFGHIKVILRIMFQAFCLICHQFKKFFSFSGKLCNCQFQKTCKQTCHPCFWCLFLQLVLNVNDF